MTKFNRALFQYHGGYLTYGPDNKFVARFKYSSRDRAGFVSFLIKNFTTEEYFAALAAQQAPAKILEAKGYISKTIALVVTSMGYPATRAGVDAYLDSRIAARV